MESLVFALLSLEFMGEADDIWPLYCSLLYCHSLAVRGLSCFLGELYAGFLAGDLEQAVTLIMLK